MAFSIWGITMFHETTGDLVTVIKFSLRNIVSTPKISKTALENGWLEKQPSWTEMIEDYKRINQKSQTDTENVYLKLTAYHKAFSYLFTRLKTIA